MMRRQFNQLKPTEKWFNGLIQQTKILINVTIIRIFKKVKKLLNIVYGSKKIYNDPSKTSKDKK